MRPNWLFALILILAAAVIYRHLPATIIPTPQPEGPDLYSAFSVTDDKAQAHHDCLIFAELNESLAECIEYDGKLDKPRLTTGLHVDDLRRWAREYELAGRSLAGQYPALPQVLRSYFDPILGTTGRPLEELDADGRSIRQKWISALRQTAVNGRWTADKLLR